MAEGVIVGNKINQIPRGRAGSVLHRVEGAFACAPMGICVVSGVSILIGDGEDNILARSLA